MSQTDNSNDSLRCVILEFAKIKLNSKDQTFHAKDLEDYVNNRTVVAPSSPTRILQLMRKTGQLNYQLISRSKSFYRILSVTGYSVSENRIDKAKKFLSEIVEFVNYGDTASEVIWDIMTALRGPDNCDSVLKELTTARLRHTIGFRMSAYSSDGNPGFITNPAPIEKEFNIDNYVSPTDKKASGHFVFHYNEAVKALEKLNIK